MAGGALANAATFFFEQGDLAMFDLSRYLAHTVLLGKTAPRARLTLAAVDVAAAARFGTCGRNDAADVTLDALEGEVTTDALLIALISGLTLAASDAARARAFLRRRSRDVPAEKGLALRGLAATLASPPTPRSIAAGLWALALEPDLMRLPLHQVALRLAEGLAGDPRSVTPLRAGLALMLVELARRAGVEPLENWPSNLTRAATQDRTALLDRISAALQAAGEPAAAARISIAEPRFEREALRLLRRADRLRIGMGSSRLPLPVRRRLRAGLIRATARLISDRPSASPGPVRRARQFRLATALAPPASVQAEFPFDVLLVEGRARRGGAALVQVPKELEDIARLYRQRGARVRLAARRDEVLAFSHSARVLHIAGHFEPVLLAPMQSHFPMAAGGPPLTLADLAGLAGSMECELAVFNGCDTHASRAIDLPAPFLRRGAWTMCTTAAVEDGAAAAAAQYLHRTWSPGCDPRPAFDAMMQAASNAASADSGAPPFVLLPPESDFRGNPCQ